MSNGKERQLVDDFVIKCHEQSKHPIVSQSGRIIKQCRREGCIDLPERLVHTMGYSDDLDMIFLLSSAQPLSDSQAQQTYVGFYDNWNIQSAVSGSSNLSLRRAKNRGEGVNMVYQSRKSTGGITEVKASDRFFDPKNFLDQIEKVDASGLVIPEWRRQVLAKHAAEKAQKEYEEKKLFEDNEERFKNVPAWKRAIIEKKEAEVRHNRRSSD